MAADEVEVGRLSDQLLRYFIVRFRKDLYPLMHYVDNSGALPHKMANRIVDLSIEVNNFHYAAKSWSPNLPESCIVVTGGKLNHAATVRALKNKIPQKDYVALLSVFGCWKELETETTPLIERVMRAIPVPGDRNNAPDGAHRFLQDQGRGVERRQRERNRGDELEEALEHHRRAPFLLFAADRRFPQGGGGDGRVQAVGRPWPVGPRVRLGHRAPDFAQRRAEARIRLAEAEAAELVLERELTEIERLQALQEGERPEFARRLRNFAIAQARLMDEVDADFRIGLRLEDDEEELDTNSSSEDEQPQGPRPPPHDLQDVVVAGAPVREYPALFGPNGSYMRAAAALAQAHGDSRSRMFVDGAQMACVLRACNVCCERGYKIPFEKLWKALGNYDGFDKGIEVCVPICVESRFVEGLEIMATDRPHLIRHRPVFDNILRKLELASFPPRTPQFQAEQLPRPVRETPPFDHDDDFNFALFADLLFWSARIPEMLGDMGPIWARITNRQRGLLDMNIRQVPMTQADKQLALDQLDELRERERINPTKLFHHHHIAGRNEERDIPTPELPEGDEWFRVAAD